MVVGFNEAHLLDKCLSSLSFCDEIIYTDLGSVDNSVAIAQKYCSTIYLRDRVPSGEYIQSEIIQYLKNDWVIFLDPDEVVDYSLVNSLKEVFKKIKDSPSVGAVLVPWLFYFKSKPIKGTIWGGINSKYFLVNKHRFEFLPITHYGRKIKEGYQTIEIAPNENRTNVLHHYWMNSYSVFFKKHLRYLKNEGRDQFLAGVRFISVKHMCRLPFKEFAKSFWKCSGYKDGLLGLFLSLFWAFYQSYIVIDIFFIQLAQKIRFSKIKL